MELARDLGNGSESCRHAGFRERNPQEYYPLVTILTDNGREYCGRHAFHLFELFLPLEEIEHRSTPVRRPQSNGIVERLHRTLPDEHFRVQGRVTFYESLDNYLHVCHVQFPVHASR